MKMMMPTQVVGRRFAAAAARRTPQQARCTSAFSTSVATGARSLSTGAAALASRWSQQQQQQRSNSHVPMATAAVAAAAIGMGFAATVYDPAQCEEGHVEGGYTVNPIQNVTALLRLYEEIDKNMEVLTNRMLADLKQRVDKVPYLLLKCLC